MLLAEIWAELRDLPRTIGRPLRDPSWFRKHTKAHLVGGPSWWAVGCYFWFSPLSFKAWAFAVAATVIRQGWMRETKGVREFPLYAMVWDSLTSSAAAAVVALLWVLIRG